MIEAHWPAVDPFDSEHAGIRLPPPVLAIDNTVVIAGLSFTWHNKPDSDVIGLWVNTIYVTEQKRHRGIASTLLDTASDLVAPHYASYGLYAYTDTAALYESNGWDLVSTIDAHSVYQYNHLS